MSEWSDLRPVGIQGHIQGENMQSSLLFIQSGGDGGVVEQETKINRK